MIIGVPHTATADDLSGYLLECLADYKVPRRWTFVEALPRSAMGKVLKRQLRDTR